MSKELVRQMIGRRRFLRLAMAQTGAIALLSAIGCAAPAAAPAPTTAPAAPAPTRPAAPAPTTAPAAQAPKPTAAPVAQATAAPTTAPAAAARLGELAVGIDADPVSLDTRLVTATIGYPIVHHFSEPLTFRDGKGKLLPWLAESWEVEGNLVWKLKLRKNVKFDNGEPFDAESVKYTMDCFITPDLFPKTTAQKRGFFAALEKVDIVDSHTVAFKTKYPSRNLLSQLTSIGMLPPKAARELGEKFGTNVIGTGPYKLAEYVPGTRLVAEAKKDYWGGAPAHDKLTLRFLPESATRVAALEAGEVAYINNLSPDQVDRVKSNAKLDIAEVMSTRLLHLHMIVDRPPFNDVRVRKAMNHAFDREGIIKAMLAGHAQVNDRWVYSPSIPYAKEQPPYKYDLNEAKKLLSDAGIAGVKIKYGHTTGRFLNDKQIGQVIGQQLEKLGFNVSIETGEWGGLFQKMTTGYFDIWFTAYAGVTLEPDRFLSFIYKSDTSWNRLKNPKIDELLVKGLSAIDDKVAEPIYHEIQSIVWNDAINAWLYFQPELQAVNKKLRNHQPRPDEFLLFKDVYVEK